MSAGPSRSDVERQFVRLLSGEASRDEIDRWSGRFVTEDFDVTDEGVWTALGRLLGVDLRHGPGLPYCIPMNRLPSGLPTSERAARQPHQ